jgi:O-antigen ligase
MGNIYNYLKDVWRNLQKETKLYPVFFSILLVFWTTTLPYAINSFALLLLVTSAVLGYKKREFTGQIALYFPIALYVLMLVSLAWTTDISGTTRALSKGLPLLLFSLVFLFYPAKKFLPQITKGYAYGVLAYTIFCLLKALFRYSFTQDIRVFFYHELVTNDVNAIHVSVYVALAIFIFIQQIKTSKITWVCLPILLIFLVLLSSKNILVIALLLCASYGLTTLKSRWKSKAVWTGIATTVLVLVLFSGKIIERFKVEWESNTIQNSVNTELSTPTQNVYNVSVAQAWNQAVFSANDYFAGTAFRVYQIRIFCEMLQEDNILFTGYGLNATDAKIAQKRIEHQLYPGYETKNFHNEYIQLFAELGIFGLLLLLAMLYINIRNAFRSKDFVHISFAVLMISLFLTESFLSRQRGLVFFTLMYGLFNSTNALNASSEAKLTT